MSRLFAFLIALTVCTGCSAPSDLEGIEARWQHDVEDAIATDRTIIALENWLSKRPEGLSALVTPSKTVMLLETVSDGSRFCPDWKVLLTIYHKDDPNLERYEIHHDNACLGL